MRIVFTEQVPLEPQTQSYNGARPRQDDGDHVERPGRRFNDLALKLSGGFLPERFRSGESPRLSFFEKPDDTSIVDRIKTRGQRCLWIGWHPL